MHVPLQKIQEKEEVYNLLVSYLQWLANKISGFHYSDIFLSNF